MRILAFLAGDLAVQQWIRLPSVSEYLAFAVLAIGLAWLRNWRLMTFVMGLLWAAGFADWRLSQGLPPGFSGAESAVTGVIADIPQQDGERAGFEFRVLGAPPDWPERMRLSWYGPRHALAAGQCWQMTVKIKKPHGRVNAGGFDYEQWLFASGIMATGYVKNKPAPVEVADCALTAGPLVWRQALAKRLDAVLQTAHFPGLLKALTLGERSDVTVGQWDVLRKTGTTHLAVISGSHIGLLAGLVYWLAAKGWAVWGTLRPAPQRVAVIAAWLFAASYTALVGFSIPTQRALIMLSVALSSVLLQRNVQALHTLLLALLVVILVDPLAVLSIGFWLSFASVALILYVSSGRLARPGYWLETGAINWVTALGLAPLLILFFQQVSVVAPLANLLAVPAIGLLVVPLGLAAVLLLGGLPVAAVWLLTVADGVLFALWQVLEYLADWSWAVASWPEPSWVAMVLAVGGVLLLSAPRGLPARHLGVLLLLPLLTAKAVKPMPGEMRLTMLDVGQGLAAVVQTAGRTLVFDTGGKFLEQSDMGASVVVPFLRNQGIAEIDMLVISHGDNDHSGGAESLWRELPVRSLLTSVPERFTEQDAQACRAGQTWVWDGVEFGVLSPSDVGFASENDNSCVLKVTTARHSLLLTGDIQQTAERVLVERYGNGLHADILLAPHHGSKTSSSWAFLQAVAPRWVLIPAGHQNRFGFPHRDVLARYRQLGSAWLTSAEQGAIQVETIGDGVQIETARHQFRRYWMDEHVDH